MKTNFHSKYASLLRYVIFNGRPTSPRGKATLELEDVVVDLGADSDDGFVTGRTSMRYLLAETAWYCSRDPSVAWVKDYASLWGRVANPDGTANSNYGEKIWTPARYNTEWNWALGSLLADPDTRQAVMVVHRPEHHWVGNKDVPCTLTVSFTIREGMLKMRAHMRSSDAWFGLPYDVPFFRWLQRRMLAELNSAGFDGSLRLGSLRVMLDNLHIYAEKLPGAKAFLDKCAAAPSWVNPVPADMGLDETAALCRLLLEDLEREGFKVMA